MKLTDINIRDPFVVPFDGKYYMYGTRGYDCWGIGSGFDVYISDDLVDWSEPVEVFKTAENMEGWANYWAPEVHYIDGKFYMFASFLATGRERGTYILKSDKPEGPFAMWSEGSITPEDWSCLDGTYYEENGKKYMIFCHEWTQIVDGEVCAVKMTDDLKKADGEPVTLFKGSDMFCVGHKLDEDKKVTDGPFVAISGKHTVLMWSSFADGKYRVAFADSDNGIEGPWTQEQRYLLDYDAGHGMTFKAFDGQEYFICHSPNGTPNERPVLTKVEITDTVRAK